MTKENKDAVRIVWQEIKHLQRYDLNWEWMAESKNGEYVKIKDIDALVLEMLHNKSKGATDGTD